MPRLFEPRPTIAPCNVTNIFRVGVEHGGYVFLHHTLGAEFSNFANVGLGKLGVTVPLSAYVVAWRLVECAVIDAIDMVGLRSIPPQILKAVVGAIAVLMARFVVQGTRADKGFEHQLVNVGRTNLAVTEYGDSFVSVFHGLQFDKVSAVWVKAARFAATHIDGDNRAIVGNVVTGIRCLSDFAPVRNLLDLFRYHTSSIYTFSIS